MIRSLNNVRSLKGVVVKMRLKICGKYAGQLPYQSLILINFYWKSLNQMNITNLFGISPLYIYIYIDIDIDIYTPLLI